MKDKINFINSSFNEQIAYSRDDLNSEITIFFFGGYSSSMDGTKATALSKWCIDNHLNFVRFDYSGHGISKGAFEDGGISKWTIEASEIFEKFRTNKNIIVGSSMGGWISLIVTMNNFLYVNGLVGIASAPDFVVGEWERLSDEQKEKIRTEGKIVINWDKYSEDYTITYKFLEDGKKNMLLKGPINISCPVRLLHGQKDQVVHFSTSEKIIELLETKNKKLIIINDGDHSLSRETDLHTLYENINELIK